MLVVAVLKFIYINQINTSYNQNLYVGNGWYLKIFHDGTDSFIHGTTSTRQLKIRGQEIRVVNSKRITRESGNIFLKSRKGNLAFYGGIAQAAFLPGVKAARTRPKEYTGGF